jgi:hypothetical protein
MDPLIISVYPELSSVQVCATVSAVSGADKAAVKIARRG